MGVEGVVSELGLGFRGVGVLKGRCIGKLWRCAQLAEAIMSLWVYALFLNYVSPF